MKERLKKIAHQLVELEKALDEGQTQKDTELKMLKLIGSLKLNELMEIDEYIQQEKLLTK